MDYLNISETFPSLAQKRTRVFAAIVDYIIYFICFWIIAITYGEKHFTADGYSYVVENGYAKLAILIFWVVLFPVLEGQKGQTIGKRIFKIKVLKIDYSEARLSHSIVRHYFHFYLIQLLHPS